MPRLGIIGWRKGWQIISVTKLLREHLNMGLAEAHEATHSVLIGEAVWYFFEDPAKAEALKEALEKVGATVAMTDATKKSEP